MATAATTTHGFDLRSADLRLISLTALVVLGSTLVIGKVIQAAGLGELGQPLAGAPLAGSTLIYQLLARRGSAGGLTPAGVVPFSGYEVRSLVMAVLGAFVIVGTAQLGSFVGAVLTGTIEGGLGASIATAILVAFAIGRWIGLKAASNAYATLLVTVVVARIVGSLVDWALLTDELRAQFGMTDPLYLAYLAIGAVVWAIPGLLGVAVGRRGREAGYLAYLLTRVQPGARQSVMELVYDETRRAPG